MRTAEAALIVDAERLWQAVTAEVQLVHGLQPFWTCSSVALVDLSWLVIFDPQEALSLSACVHARTGRAVIGG